MSSSSKGSLSSEVPSLTEIRTKTTDAFGRRPCLWQIKITQAILGRERDVICVAATGAGKTLTFWMPLLFRPQGIQVVITPLNILGSQNKVQLEARSIRAISIDAKTATSQNIQDIEDGKYRVVVVNPEIAFSARSRFERIWKSERFASRIISVIWDEAHCVSTWSSFRKEYADAGRLRYLISRHVPYLVPSATLPRTIMDDVTMKLRVHQSNVTYVLRSNDRPNVYISVRKIKHALKSFRDLDFLIPQSWHPGQKVPKFLVFFDSIQESVNAATTLGHRMPKELRDKLVWFNSDMTAGFREWATAAFKESYDGKSLCGLFCTDSFGMGIDIPDIELVVQWRASCDLDTLWQRFGRAARGNGTEAVAIILVEPKYFDDEKEKALQAAQARAKKAEELAARREVAKRKRENGSAETSQKRVRRGQVDASGEGAMDVDEGLGQVAVISPRSADTSAPNTGESPLSAYETLRISYRRAVQAKEVSTKVKAKKETDSISVEMDNLINAASRPFRCYWVPIMAYYENDRRDSDHMECERAGCKRCHLPPSVICCELCNSTRSTPSDIFARLAPPLPDPSMPAESGDTSGRIPRPSRLTKFDMTPADVSFRDALHDFRCNKMLKLYGRAKLKNLGPGAIMSDDVLSRIADCAHLHKLSTKEDLQREVPKWRRVVELADEVLILVQQHFPKPQLYTTAPLQLRQNGQSVNEGTEGVVTPAKPPAARKCGICGNTGHNRRTCPSAANAPPSMAAKENATSTSSHTANERNSSESSALPRPTTMLDSLLGTPSYRQMPPRILTPAAIAEALRAQSSSSTRP